MLIKTFEKILNIFLQHNLAKFKTYMEKIGKRECNSVGRMLENLIL